MIASVLLAAAATVSSMVDTSRGPQPFIVYPGAAGRDPAAAKTVVLVLSGEGGWRAFDRMIAGWLAEAGYWVGGIDSMKYFWDPQDDREVLAADVRRFTDALAKSAASGPDVGVVYAGYSFGADLAPWIAGAKTRDPRCRGLVMIGPDSMGSLEFRVSEMMGMTPTEHIFDTGRALADARAFPVLFLHGGKDGKSDAAALAAGFAGRKELIVVPDATHHFAGHEDELKRALVEGLSRLLTR